MKKVKIKIPAKINLTLDVTGAENGYHQLDSLAASINIFDAITLFKRKDKLSSVSFSHPLCEFEKVQKENISVEDNQKKEKNKNKFSNAQTHAEKAANRFSERFGVNGADIKINNRIPSGGGFGGSSADIAGVLLAMKKLYKESGDVTEIANSLGSDVAYMLKGGYARLRGRGEKVETVAVKRRFYLLLVMEKEGVSSAEAYKKYDENEKTYPAATEVALKALQKENDAEFFAALKNDLYEAAAQIFPKVETNLMQLQKYGTALMTGSGSGTYAIYSTKKERDKAYKELKRVFRGKLIKAHTL